MDREAGWEAKDVNESGSEDGIDRDEKPDDEGGKVSSKSISLVHKHWLTCSATGLIFKGIVMCRVRSDVQMARDGRLTWRKSFSRS